MFSIVSILIAFFATAGAIPLCKSLRRRFRGETNLPAEETPSIAGAGMLAGIGITLFYVDADLANVVADFYNVLVSPPRGLLLAGLAIMAPLAAIFNERPNDESPALTSGLALMQLVFLVMFAALADFTPVARMSYDAFATIALPTMGALIAVLIYLCPTPWRAKAIISLDLTARLGLGFLVAWGALAIGNVPAAQGQGSAPLAWILAVPLFELVHRCVIARSPFAHLLPPHAPASIMTFAAITGGLGIVLWLLHVPGGWSELAILPALVVYLMVPRVIFSDNRARQQTPIASSSGQVAS